MKTMKKFTLASLILALLMSAFAGCALLEPKIEEVPTDEVYSFVNPVKTKAEPDTGFVIDGIYDEDAYQNNAWLNLSNNSGGNQVDIAMTTHFGEQGMYFIFDVTESGGIYVNPSRSSTLNSCIEFYLAPAGTKNHKENNFFEIDLVPDGTMSFKRSNGKDGYIIATSMDSIMAQLGVTTKGGPINTEECYGYVLECFIPWAYMEWLGVDVDMMKQYALVDPAHITSFNYDGKNGSIDRYWYAFISQKGVAWADVANYYKFGAEGYIG